MVTDAAQTQLIGKEIPNSKTQNLSGHGLRFETSLPLKVGDQLEITLHLSSSEVVNAIGQVVRSERQGKDVYSVALEFLLVEATEQERLLQFLVQAQARE